MLLDGGADEEERWLTEGIAGVTPSTCTALDSNHLKDALFSTQMLSELRTSRLSPHKYYELYMSAFDELRKLEMFFREETRQGSCSVVNLHELVQHAGNVLPRLLRTSPSQAKIVLTCKNQQEMNRLKDTAEQRGIPTFVVADAGRTQVLAGSKTVLAIGPGRKADID